MLLRGLVRGTALPVAILILVAASGCRPETSAVGDTSLAFRKRMQTHLTLYSIALSDPVAKHDRDKVKSVLQRIYTVSTPPGSEPYISLAVLDQHGVTVATISGAETGGARNYGKYQIVSRVLHKRKPMQSALYLQGGKKMYITCAPLLKGDKVVGVLIMGIDAEHLRRSGISEREFMSFSFSAPNGANGGNR